VDGHDRGDGGVDAPGAVLRLLGEPGPPGVFAQDGVADVPGQAAVAVVGQLLVDDQLVEPRGRRSCLSYQSAQGFGSCLAEDGVADIARSAPSGALAVSTR
jgi:hypothetical protein